jgi:uncharacterized protein (DUF58 family)
MASTNVYTLDEVLSPRQKETLRHLELFARRAVDGLLQGVHRSKRKGVSTEFDHHKLYHPGDPLKHIDWKVSARHDKHFVKRYLEDTAMAVRLVVDRSASMLQKSEGPTKYLIACQVAASLAYLILKQRDSTGLVLTSADKTHWLPTSSAGLQLVSILRALAGQDAAAADNVAESLKVILDRGERKGLLVLVSDLMFPPAPVQKNLARLGSQGNEVLLIHMRDPVEEDFPFNRWVRFGDLENPAVKHLLDTVPLKKIYLEEYQALLNEWRAWAKKNSVHLVSFRTDEKVETVLSEYIAWRSGLFGK